MNTLNFLMRLQPFLAADDVTTMSQTHKLALLTAINDAATQWAKVVPAAHKTHADGYAVFPAPTTVTVTVTDGSTAITGLSASDIGKTIVITGDATPNRLVTPTKLRMPCVGASGSVQATLYGDACALPANWEGMASSVFWERDVERRDLAVAMDLYRIRKYAGREIHLADPEYYVVETGQTADGAGAPRAILRLLPIPAVTQRLTFDYIGPPSAWSMTDFTTARELGFTEAHWIYMVQMTLGRLVKVPGMLHKDVTLDALVADAAAAEKAAQGSRPSFTPQPLMIGTPFNW